MSNYVSNIVINGNADFNQTFTLTSVDTNSEINLSGYSVSSQMRKHSGSSTATNFTSSILNAAAGQVSISLSNTETSNLKEGRYVYDIVIEKDSVKTKVVEGMVLVIKGVTR